MPRESDKGEEAESRVTRSSRRKAQSDLEDSPSSISATSPKITRKKMNSISEQDVDMESNSVQSLSESQLSRSKNPGTEEAVSVRKTRARANSTLTEENVTALNNTPARRTTRRNSGLMDSNVITPVVSTTPGRRTTRRSSITSVDSESVTSTTATGRPRRNLNVAKTLAEEDESTPAVRRTPGRTRSGSISEQATPRKTPGRKSIAQSILIEEDEDEVIEGTPAHNTSISKSKVHTTPNSTPSSEPYPLFMIKTSSLVEAAADANVVATVVEDSPEKSTSDDQAKPISPEMVSNDIGVADVPITTVDEANQLSASEVNNDSMDSEASNYMDASNVIGKSEDVDEPMTVSTPEAEPSNASSIDQSLIVVEDSSFDAQNGHEQSKTPGRKSLPVNDSVVHIDSPSKTPSRERSFTVKGATPQSTPGRKRDASFTETDANMQVSKTVQNTPGNKNAGSFDVEEIVDVPASPRTTPGRKSVLSASTVELIEESEAKVEVSEAAAVAVSDEQLFTADEDSQENEERKNLESPKLSTTTPIESAADPEELETIETSLQESPVTDNEECSSPLKASKRKSILAISSDNESSPCKTEPLSADKINAQRARRQTTGAILHEKSTNASDVLSRSWSQAVHGTPSSAIDRSQKPTVTEDVVKKPVSKPKLEDFDDDDEEDSENARSENSFINDEAEEDDENSMDSEEREYLDANEVPVDGISIGSEDSHQEDVDEEEDDDSFIVSDSEMFEELAGSGDDLSDGAGSDSDGDKATKKKSKRSVKLPVSSDDDEDVAPNTLRQEEDEPSNEDVEMDSEEEPEEKEAISVTEQQVNKLLSKSVHQVGKKAKKNKHNKSLSSVSDSDVNTSFSTFVAQQKSKAAEKKVEAVVGTESVPEPEDVEMETDEVEKEPTPVKPKTPKVKAAKVVAPAYDDIMSRCDLILAQANEARRQEKLQNKKDVPEELIEKKKSKKEQKILEKARRAANLLKIQQEEAEKQKRKAEKKLAKKNAAPVDQISQALAHGIELLSKESSEVNAPKSVAAETDAPTKKRKKHQLDAERISSAVVAEEVPVVAVKKNKKTKLEAPAIVEEPVVQSKKPKKLKPVESVEIEHAHKKQKISSPIIEEPETKTKKQKKPQLDKIELPPPDVVKSKKSKKSHKQTENITPETSPEIAETKHSKKSIKQAVESSKSKQQQQPKTVEPVVEKIGSKKNKRVRAENQEVPETTQPAAKKFKKTKGESAPKKLLNILTKTNSLESESEPVKPSKKQPSQYNVLQVRSVASDTNAHEKLKNRKRKPAEDVPAKPQWTSAGEFVVSKIPKDSSENTQHVVAHGSAGTDFIVSSLSKKNKLKLAHGGGESTSKPVASVVAQVADFRAKATNSDRVKRIPTAEMLQHKKKMQAYTRF